MRTMTCLIGLTVDGSVQFTTTERCEAQVASPSLAVTVMVAGPALLQVKVGVADDGFVRTPEVEVQVRATGEGALSGSAAVALRPSELPVVTSEGLASSVLTVGQTLTVPLTLIEPLFGWIEHETWIWTWTVAADETSNDAEPAHMALPS